MKGIIIQGTEVGAKVGGVRLQEVLFLLFGRGCRGLYDPLVQSVHGLGIPYDLVDFALSSFSLRPIPYGSS